MGIRKISVGLVAAALMGTSSMAATAPVSQLSLAPSARASAPQGHKDHLAGSAAIVVGVLAVAAVGGGVYAATKHHHHSNVSP